MAAAFRPVNSPLATELTEADLMTSNTSPSRPGTAPHPQQQLDDSKTPTRASFINTMNGQKPLPTSPFPQAIQIPDSTANMPRRENSLRSSKSSPPDRNSMDMDMDESDGETGTVEENAISDDESVNADGTRSGKKKKSQRFYCTDYPPCNLSFTRSEHLARHIRKHTGERPFQCHCSRRFSRLDNLRQHAQTVHVNEDIPIDSLAATGSRFQRQIRTDRVRQAGNRARASTGGSAGGPHRSHAKSLSTSSINSLASIGTPYSPQNDSRRRPSLATAADPRSRMSLESYRSAADSNFSFRPQSPGDFTPTSATFSTAQSSPRWGGDVASPATSHSRSQSMYTMGGRTPSRRLSVPSGANPFQSGPGQIPGRSSFGPGLVNSSNTGVFQSSNSSLVSSPTISNSGWSSRRDSTSSTADDGWRRRTWHPDSRGFNGNPGQLNPALSQTVRPNPAPPIANPSQPHANFRLPGIESFDPIPHRPATPPRRTASPMMVDPERPPRHLEPVSERNLNMYDVSLQRGLNRLDIGHKTPPRDGAGTWASEANKAVQAQAEQVRQNPPTVRFEEQPRPSHQTPNSIMAGRSLHQHTMSAPNLASIRENKRHGWYHGPAPTSNELSQQPPTDARGAHVDRMVHPNFTGFPGFPAREQPPPQQQQAQGRPNNPDPLRRLEALVAVATSESSTATAY